MKVKTKNQTGFGIVGIIIVVLVVGLIAAAGWYVFQRNRPELGQATKNNGQSKSDNSTVTGESEPAAAYLKIKEWEVGLPLGKEIKDAYYVEATAHTGSPDGLPGAVFLSLRSLTGDKCDPNNNNRGGRGAVGLIARFLPDEQDSVTGQLLTEEYPNGTQIGEYHYAYQSWKRANPCASEKDLESIDAAFALSARNIIRSSTESE